MRVPPASTSKRHTFLRARWVRVRAAPCELRANPLHWIHVLKESVVQEEDGAADSLELVPDSGSRVGAASVSVESLAAQGPGDKLLLQSLVEGELAARRSGRKLMSSPPSYFEVPIRPPASSARPSASTSLPTSLLLSETRESSVPDFSCSKSIPHCGLRAPHRFRLLRSRSKTAGRINAAMQLSLLPSFPKC